MPALAGFSIKSPLTKTLARSVLWRYFAIGLQFGVVILVAHRASVDVAGRYFALFGFVTVASMAVGFGLPDGLVRYLPMVASAATATQVRSVISSALRGSTGISVSLALMGAVVALELLKLNPAVSWLVAAWGLTYALTVMFAQILVAVGKPASGTFVMYSAISIAYTLTLVPYLFFAPNVTLNGMLSAAVLGTASACLLTGVFVVREIRMVEDGIRCASRGMTQQPRTKDMFIAGMPIMLSRFMQSCLPWIPVWLLVALSSAAEAAIYASASRLTVAVTSVIATLRFSIRPEIVRLSRERRYAEIARLSRRCSLVASVPPLAGLVLLMTVGSYVVPIVLSEAYSDVNRVLQLLMLGVLAEAFGGVSDEILKMTGRTRILLAALALALLYQLGAGYLLARHGAYSAALATVMAFWILYVAQVMWLSSRTPINLLSPGQTAHAEGRR